jgi:hypothetical protein
MTEHTFPRSIWPTWHEWDRARIEAELERRQAIWDEWKKRNG